MIIIEKTVTNNNNNSHNNRTFNVQIKGNYALNVHAWTSFKEVENNNKSVFTVFWWEL